ncbi:hypothetical protein ACFFUU_10185 [Flavobacterium paronense]|uniref:Uncharacterized protein n=1 Tax=Flavobacterium paronense TaxID=1392775 RepID=A0ABV5GFT6_9FLAO
MEPIDFFKKTFVFVFAFYIVFKAVGLVMNKFEEFNLVYVLKTVLAALVTALILGIINYFAKVDFFTKKGEQKPKDN